MEYNVKITTKEWSEMGYKEANKILKPMPPEKRLDALMNAPKSQVPFEYWRKESRRQIMHMYMNATVTTNCNGHSKADRNKALANMYLKMMEEYKIPVPSIEVTRTLGIFNGDGAS